MCVCVFVRVCPCFHEAWWRTTTVYVSACVHYKSVYIYIPVDDDDDDDDDEEEEEDQRRRWDRLQLCALCCSSLAPVLFSSSSSKETLTHKLAQNTQKTSNNHESDWTIHWHIWISLLLLCCCRPRSSAVSGESAERMVECGGCPHFPRHLTSLSLSLFECFCFFWFMERGSGN